MNENVIFANLYNNIRKYRKLKGLSAYELSLRIGMDKSYISSLELGKFKISLTTLIKVCNVLDVDIIKMFE